MRQVLDILGIVQRHELLVGIGISTVALSPTLFYVHLLRQRRVVARILQHAYFVFYLHHGHCSDALVLRGQMLHEAGKGL